MGKFRSFMKRSAFLWALALVFLLADPILTETNPLKSCGAIRKNDFEITQLKHPEKTWDKVFFGASGVTAGYDEDASASGYVNLGMDYGVITDLYEMVTEGYVHIGSELVIGTDFLCFDDNLDTISSYMWHKQWYEPYVYFERLRLSPLAKDGLSNLLRGEAFTTESYVGQSKSLYDGKLTDAEMQEKLAVYEEEFWHLDASAFDKNLEALEKLIVWCQARGIRVRALWVPWNTDYEIPQIQYDVQARADAIYEKYGVEVLDLTTAFEPDCLHDLWHVNTEVGRVKFMEVVDPWLSRE